MKSEEHHQLIPGASKLLNSHSSIQSLITYVLCFASGLAIGIVLSFYLQNHPQDSQIRQFSAAITTNVTQSSPPPPVTCQSPPPPPPPSPPPPQPTRTEGRVGLNEFLQVPNVTHHLRDEELLWRASMMPKVEEYPFKRTPKVAFMFLAKGDLPLAPLWEMFFKGHEGLFSIYVHSQPSYKGGFPPDSVFHARHIPSKTVVWGESSMIEAERRLLGNALLDLSNERFVLLSESCIPLYNFKTVYDYLTKSTTSFVESYDKSGPVGRGRYNRRMKPHIMIEQWRKGAQWFEMNRELALEVVSDQKYYSLFKRYCKPGCYSDEHYIPTYLTMKFAKKNANRTLTWVDWSKGGPHPAKFLRTDVTIQLLERMRKQSRCVYNGKVTKVCYLFARKFTPNALDRLLRFAPTILQSS